MAQNHQPKTISNQSNPPFLELWQLSNSIYRPPARRPMPSQRKPSQLLISFHTATGVAVLLTEVGFIVVCCGGFKWFARWPRLLTWFLACFPQCRMRLHRLKHSEAHGNETSFRLPPVAPSFKWFFLWALRRVLVPACLCPCVWHLVAKRWATRRFRNCMMQKM